MFFSRLFFILLLIQSVLIAPLRAQQVSIPLGTYDYLAEIFPTDVINPQTGDLDPQWVRAKLPETITHYLLASLRRDRVIGIGFSDFTLRDTGTGYIFSFTPPVGQEAAAQAYASLYKEFVGQLVAGKGLAGAQACRKLGASCWNPVGAEYGSYWKFYLPLGLPFVRQKTVLLTHYPPYDSLVAGDYLNNATMARWNRILHSVGVPQSDYALYENTIDANPIAAPGAGQGSVFFPVLLAAGFFDTPAVIGRDYITSMLRLMTESRGLEERELTIPILVIGGQSRQFWANKYPKLAQRNPPGNIPFLNPNDSGKVTLGFGARETPFMAANHPDVGLLMAGNSCPEEPKPGSYYTEGIIAVEKSDLEAACFSVKMGEPSADFDKVVQECKATWNSDNLSPAVEEIVCANGLMDATYNIDAQIPRCTWEQAIKWCRSVNDQLCARKHEWPPCTKQ